MWYNNRSFYCVTSQTRLITDCKKKQYERIVGKIQTLVTTYTEEIDISANL